MSSSTEHNATQGPVPHTQLIDRGLVILIAVTLLAAVLVAVQSGVAHMLATAAGAFGFLLLLTPKIAAGIFIAAAVPVLVPKERISALIGQDSGFRGLVIASLAGACLPGGPAMTFPLAAGLLSSGADLGATLAFVTGWSLFSLNRTLIWELSFLPADVVGLRVLLCLPMPIMIGWAARRVLR